MKQTTNRILVAAVTMVCSISVTAGQAVATTSVTVSGEVPKNYTVLLVSRSGNSRAVAGGKFSIKLSKTDATSASLHLVSQNGDYAGPVVLKVDKKKRTGNTLLSGKSGNIGKIAMKTGYSIAAAKATAAIATKSSIKVTPAGKPSGAGRMGLPSSVSGGSVRTWGVRAGADGDKPTGEDTDKDGLPNTLDLDDDDDGKIDLVDDSNPSKAVTTGSLLFLDISKTINLHAGMTEIEMQTAIDAVFKSNNNFWLGISMQFPTGQLPDGVHMSCAPEVLWCAAGTPATLFGGGILPDSTGKPSGVTRWADMKSDGFGLSLPFGRSPNCDATVGLPEMTSSNPMCAPPHSGVNRQVIPQLPSADVKPGSLFTINLTKAGAVQKSIAGSLAPYFASVPAIKEVVVGGRTSTVDYKLKAVGGPPPLGQPPSTGPQQVGALGTQNNPFVLGSDKTITLNFWRPQRSGVTQAGEGKYVDMGGLRYGFYVGVNKVCDASAYSGLSSTLSNSPVTASMGAEPNHTPLVDAAKDAVPNSANTLSFTIDIAKCEGGGAATIGPSAQLVTLIATSPGSAQVKAYQDFYVKAG
ncbi:MAG: hypothetical protein ACKOCC_06030 [Actinomycetota bacterium]